MSASSAEIKTALRRQLREKVVVMTASERDTASTQIRERLVGQPVWQSAKSILLFAPTTSEPDLWPLAMEALRLGKHVVLPRYSPGSDAYFPCEVGDMDRDLQPGKFGIPEPGAHCPLFDALRLDLALVPGIGFTLAGGRLGRGKGYFDRLLAGVPGFKCGVAFDCQVAAEIPMEPHDVRLNCILTPSRWHLVSGPPRF